MDFYKFSYEKIFKNKRLLNKLKSLTLDGESMMQLEMVNLDWKVQDKEETNAFVFLAKKNNTICGWALIFPKINQFFFQVFIKEKYRRKGIGTKLFTMAERHVIKKNKNMFIFPWDNTSLNFYKNQNPRAIFNIYEF